MKLSSKLVPELIVRDVTASKQFYCDLIGFHIAYERKAEGFVYLYLDGVEIMLEELNGVHRQWQSGPLEPPFGRGINFQIEIADVDRLYNHLVDTGLELFLDIEDKYYETNDGVVGNRLFIVADPDGYLLRFFSPI